MSVSPADATGLCECAEGWAGPDCGICTEDAAVSERAMGRVGMT